ncbi:hypothetical protein [Candidatus Uabimicrobium sp. HlEnr_7]|uniref:hypothetical protein n=1 Tax=Candidatus Uabimicrobium helgolandensis TaxID=3095367 RepID=UPI0035582149
MDIIHKTIDIKLIQEYFQVAKSTAYYWLKNAVLDTLGDGRCIALINSKFYVLANKRNLPAFHKWITKINGKIVISSYHHTVVNHCEGVSQKSQQAIVDYLTCHNSWLKEKIPFAIIYMNCEGKKYVRNLNWIQLEKLSKTHTIATRKGKTVNLRQYLHQLAYYDNPRDRYLRYKALAALNIFR